MDSTSTSTSRFRFRDHNQEMAHEDSSDGHTTADSSSVSSNDDEEPELQSMTARVLSCIGSQTVSWTFIYSCFVCVGTSFISWTVFASSESLFLWGSFISRIYGFAFSLYNRVFSICVLNFLSLSKNQMRIFRRISFQITLPFLRKFPTFFFLFPLILRVLSLLFLIALIGLLLYVIFLGKALNLSVEFEIFAWMMFFSHKLQFERIILSMDY